MDLTARTEGGNLGDPSAIIPPNLLRGITEGTLLLEGEVKIRTPIGATEATRGSIGSQIQTGGSVSTGREVKGEIGSPLVQVQVLEHGRKPGKQPPSEALELWVKRKMGISDPHEIRRVSFLVARKIGEEGLDPVGMFEEALEENEGKLQRIFDRLGVKIAVQLSNGG